MRLCRVLESHESLRLIHIYMKCIINNKRHIWKRKPQFKSTCQRYSFLVKKSWTSLTSRAKGSFRISKSVFLYRFQRIHKIFNLMEKKDSSALRYYHLEETDLTDGLLPRSVSLPWLGRIGRRRRRRRRGGSGFEWWNGFARTSKNALFPRHAIRTSLCNTWSVK